MIRGNAVGDTMFYGRGAGDLPTASAVVGDIIDIMQHREHRRDISWNESAELTKSCEIPMKWYLRGNFSNADAEAACGKIEALAEGAVIVADLDEAAAKAAAEKLGAVSLLHVL